MIKLMMILGLFVISIVPATAAVTREPYLQLVTPASMTIVWQTDLGSASNSRVQFGTAVGNLNQTVNGSAITSPSNPGVKNHVVTIAGLSAATKYFYNVGTVTNGVQSGGTSEHFFVTAPPIGTVSPFTAWVVGDSGNGSANQIAVRDAMLQVTGVTPPNIFLHAGDIAYEDGTDAEFTSNHFSVYQDILRQTPIFPTLGNHEAVESPTAGMGPYYEAHVMPAGSSGTEAYYSFDYANAHFIVLDSMSSSRSPGSAMLSWLQADLLATAQEWVIVLFHHPPYTKGSHDSDNVVDSGGRMVDMRENVLPILEAGGVDLVLGGHSHIYERSFPLQGAFGKGSSPNFATPSKSTLISDGNILDVGDGKPSGNGAYEAGTVYVVAGHGGKSVSNANGGNHPVMFFSEAQFGSVLLDINGHTLTVRNVESTETISDTFSIEKSGLAKIVWRNTTDGAVAIWLANGLNAPTVGVLGGASPGEWKIVGVIDVDGDSKGDIVWRNTTDGTVAIWLGNGLNAPTVGVIGGVSPGEWKIVGVGDVDGDGKGDIVWRNTNTGDVVGWLMNGLSLSSSGVVGAVTTDWTIVNVGDLDGDGKADLVWRKTSTGEVVVWLMNGLSLSSVGGLGTVGTDWTIVNVGDLDGDGKADLVWRNTSTGQVVGWLMNGLSLSSSGVVGTVTTNWKIVGMKDLDGDGKDDIVWRNTTDGAVVIWLANGLNAPTVGVIGGASPAVWKIVGVGDVG